MGGNIISGSSALLAIFMYIFYVGYRRFTKPLDAFDVLPWAGLPEGRFAKWRARFDPTSGRAIIRQAFTQYSQKGQSFVYQTFLGRAYIVLPPSQAQWIIDQADDVLSFKDATIESLALDYTTLHPQISITLLHHDVIKNELTRSLSSTSSLVLDELQTSFSLHWGDDKMGWTEQNIWHSMTKIFAQTSSRIFFGLPLCRDQDFLQDVVKYAELVVGTGTKIRGLPDFLKPILGYFLLKPNHQSFDRIYSKLGPVIEQRKADVEKTRIETKEDYEEPVDLLQWLVRRAYETGDPAELDTALLCKRLGVVCFAAIHTTSLTSTNLILDLMSAKPQYSTIAKLREEVLQVHNQCKGKWDKASLAKLVQLDSTIRESQRMHGASNWALHRKIIARDGIRLPDGTVAPQGTHIAISGYNVQHDVANYSDPEVFDPFRFSRSRADMTDAVAADTISGNDARTIETRSAQILNDRKYAAVSTGLTHFPFGHGRHACPGRFFAIQEVKLMLVHVLMNYEMKPMDDRPPTPWLRDLMIPNMDATVSVKRIDTLSV